MGVIIYDGKSSSDFGIIVEAFPAMNHGAKRGEPYQIAGRNGVFYDEDGTFDNYVQAYQIAIREGLFRPADKRCADIQAWLSGSGFKRLEDSFEPEFFKLARYAGPLNVEQILGHVGRCTLEFECQPERWLKSGETPVDLSSSSTIENPTAYTAKPGIAVFGSSGSLIPIAVDGDVLMEVQGQGSDAVLIDCAEGTIQNNGGTNLYGATIFYTSYHDFPTIPPGAHTITATGATALLVLPRWYVL